MSDFKANCKIGRIDITPGSASFLSGFAQRKEAVNNIHCPLEANAVLLSQGEQSILFLTLDTLFATTELKKFILQEVARYDKRLDESAVIIGASHTHYAPSLETNRPLLGKYDEAYFEHLKEKLATLLANLFKVQTAQSCELQTSTEPTSGINANRRRKLRSKRSPGQLKVGMEIDEAGPKSEDLHLIKVIDNESQQVLAAIWSFACHPTNLPAQNQISSEFPGLIRQKLRIELGYNLPVLFFQGFAGDLRAYVQPPAKSLRYKLSKWLKFPYPTGYYRLGSQEQYNNWVAKLYKQFHRIWYRGKSVRLQQTTVSMHKQELAALGVSTLSAKALIVRKIAFGEDCALVTLSAEVVCEYEGLLKQVFKEKHLIPVGYVDAVFGYLPTDRQIREGGYESGEFMEAFEVKGKFEPKIETIVKACLQKLPSAP